MMCPLVAQQLLDCVALMGDFSNWGAFAGDLLHPWEKQKTCNFDSELGPFMAGTQYIITNTLRTPSVGVNVFIEEMHTQKSECQVGVANDFIKYIEAGDTNMMVLIQRLQDEFCSNGQR